MTDRLPLLSAQLSFALAAQRSGRRATVTLMFRTPPCQLSAADVREVLGSVLLRNPALSYRIGFCRGIAYQEWYPEPCDFAELHTARAEDVSGCMTEVIEAFETSLDGATMAARLIRSPENDHLLLVLDHAMVDEKSMLIIKQQLASPSDPDELQLVRYQAAINNRIAFEETAVNGPGIKFWTDRLGGVGEFPRTRVKSTRVHSIERLPDVAVPLSFRGSLFPYVLYSIHRALRDVAEPGPTVIGYPWGGRNAAYADVVGCFMNTVISLDTPGLQQTPDSPDGFVRSWYQEIDHADVPFITVTSLGSTFTGSVTAMLSYTHGIERTVNIAGVPAVEVESTETRPPEMCTFLAAAAVCKGELQLRLLLDEESADYGVQEFGARWLHWLTTAISTKFTQQKS
ncbi:hypothetical protein J2Z21_009295 [Streptomyces griseochromogenes]|uniref:Condensation domain-containing protein n=1 Tax=Streptomyces griseochromogenes TaxID=68214 RepID=A0A1B1AZR8_9ACTN|nr:hypothetical protein [Streptomyces griseochromogenes]ANP52057.1 hypothetical protein AVL59_23005 [Streptomyces griseochromogenes]MBP2056277.1 hypothetical protein [Streptomyces griseochromogenes]